MFVPVCGFKNAHGRVIPHIIRLVDIKDRIADFGNNLILVGIIFFNLNGYISLPLTGAAGDAVNAIKTLDFIFDGFDNKMFDFLGCRAGVGRRNTYPVKSDIGHLLFLNRPPAQDPAYNDGKKDKVRQKRAFNEVLNKFFKHKT
ncbi:MAG TPA: hypothetical protein PLT76_02385 [Candidatus Omnitrophota bacterium]|nr:hypothetical protein [Candidatus Omnitrophota bacterium]